MMIVILLLFSQVLNAQTTASNSRLLLPRILANSGAMTARMSLNESILFNPASSAHSKVYSMEGVYSFEQYPNNSRAHNYTASILDTKNNDYAGGGVVYNKRVLDSNNSEWELKGIINKLFMENRLATGVGASYSKYNYSNQELKNINFNLGALFLLTEKILIGGTVYNILGDKNNIKKRSFALGVRTTFWDFFSINLDSEYTIKENFNISGALEFLYKSGIALNLSMANNFFDKQAYWGFGFGYLAPKISIFYGTMNGVNGSIFRHALSLRVFY